MIAASAALSVDYLREILLHSGVVNSTEVSLFNLRSFAQALYADRPH